MVQAFSSESRKIYTLQFRLSNNPEDNISKAKDLVNNIEDESIVLLPEMWFCGYDYDNLDKLADLSPSLIDMLCEISLRKQSIISFTVPFKDKEGIFNRAFLLEEGKIVGYRDKIKLFPLIKEHEYISPGEGNFTFNTKAGKIGILICFELRFTELVKELKDEKIDILLIPAQWGKARREHLLIFSRARAMELQCYVAVANVWGKHLGEEFAGYSGIYSPSGEILSLSEKGDTLLSAYFNKREIEKARKYLPLYV